MAQFITRGNKVQVVADGAMQITNPLQPGTYYVCWNRDDGFHLEKSFNFKKQEVIYGDVRFRVDKVIKTFLERDVNTGILLSGIKGSGKTLAAKEISIKLLNEHSIPTIIINQLFDTNNLTLFLKDIEQPVVILFEEFEKIYKTVSGPSESNICSDTQGDKSPHDYQDGLLTFLDGVITSKKLFIFTCNETRRIHDLLLNRPGRVLYHFRYTGIEEQVICEYCDDRLNNKDFLSHVLDISEYMDEGFTFDMLKAVVEETNRYNISPLESISYMNIQPNAFSKHYTVTIKSLDGHIVEPRNDYKICRIHNFLDELEHIYVRYYYIPQNKIEAKKIENLIKENNKTINNQKVKFITEVFEENDNVFESLDKPVGFNSKDDGDRIIATQTVITKSDLTQKKKNVLIYVKDNVEFTFTKIKEINLWSLLGI